VDDLQPSRGGKEGETGNHHKGQQGPEEASRIHESIIADSKANVETADG